MGQTRDLGMRIELQPMDPHCGNISIGLYERTDGDSKCFLVHTYDRSVAAKDRVTFISEALRVRAGLEDAAAVGNTEPGDQWLRFPCGGSHKRALKRVFLDLCKLFSPSELTPKPLTVYDKKAEGDLSATGVGAGVYETGHEAELPKGPKRADALARGFAKLCEAELVETDSPRFKFPCGQSHDALVGQLMYRAQNVRASLREEEEAASRGVLSAPSQQNDR